MEMTLEIAQRAALAALGKAGELGCRMSAAVVDEAGRTVVVLRGDGASFFSPESSRVKAVTAANFRRSTKALCETAEANSLFWAAAPAVMRGELLPSKGGVPISRDGRVIGAVGCGGGSADQDHECAQAGADAAST
jgi:uncharacterized protein GlcG (DUF336 family)